MKIRFWGVRGSFAMSGRDFLRYGGNTTSVELVSAAGDRLLIDLGTGATEYAKTLMAAEFGKGQGSLPILLSHTHLDHIQGLPFFTPFFIKGNKIGILGATPTSGLSLEATLQNQLAPHYSPLNSLGNLAAQGDWGFAGDYVKAMWHMLQQPEPDDYVVGTGETWSVKDFLLEAFSYAGLDWEKYVVSDPRFFRPAEVDLLLGDPTKAKTRLGWKPKVDFKTLVRMMVDADMARV